MKRSRFTEEQIIAMGTRRPIETPLAANQRWSLDFVSDQMTDGRRFHIRDYARAISGPTGDRAAQPGSSARTPFATHLGPGSDQPRTLVMAQ